MSWFSGFNPDDYLTYDDIRTLNGMWEKGIISDEQFTSPESTMEFISFLDSETFSLVKGIFGTTMTFDIGGNDKNVIGRFADTFESGGTLDELQGVIDSYIDSDIEGIAGGILDWFDDWEKF